MKAMIGAVIVWCLLVGSAAAQDTKGTEGKQAEAKQGENSTVEDLKNRIVDLEKRIGQLDAQVTALSKDPIWGRMNAIEPVVKEIWGHFTLIIRPAPPGLIGRREVVEQQMNALCNQRMRPISRMTVSRPTDRPGIIQVAEFECVKPWEH